MAAPARWRVGTWPLPTATVPDADPAGPRRARRDRLLGVPEQFFDSPV